MDYKQYWASLPSDEIGNELFTKIKDYYLHVNSSGTMRRWRLAYRAFHGQSLYGWNDTTTLGTSGEQSEKTVLKINHYRTLINRLHTLTTSQRPALKARAVNTDFTSQIQASLSESILDYYMREAHVEELITAAVEYALVYSEGFISMCWNQTDGDAIAVDPETGAAIKQGDLEFSVLEPCDIIRPVIPSAMSSKFKTDWVIVRKYVNRYSLMAKYPEMAQEIYHVFSKVDPMEVVYYNPIQGDNDLIPMYTFYHEKTEALPQGRAIDFLSNDLILLDGPLPYEEMPVYRIAPSERHSSIFGWTVGFDILGIQQAIDALASTIMTNQLTFGVSNVLVPKGSDINVQTLSDGLNLIEYDSKLGPIEPLNLTHTPPEVFSFLKELENTQQMLSGLNSAAMGHPEASIHSGAALALVSSMAIQANSGLQKSYELFLERIATGLIKVLKVYAKTPRMITITGQANRSYLKEFSKDDLSGVSRIICETVNPVSKTASGRLEIAQNLLNSGLIKTPEEYLTVLETGQLKPMYESTMRSLFLIRSENELLQNGQKPIAIATDDHALHVSEHRTVLDDPTSRMDPQLVQNTLQHIQEHFDLARSVDPALLMLTKQPPLPPAPSAQPPAPPQMPGQPGQTMDATNPIVQQAQNVRQPSMPTNPLTKNKFDPSTGGL